MTGSLRFTQSLILVAGFMIDDYIGPLGAVAYFIINKKLLVAWIIGWTLWVMLFS